ncbi:MAG: translation initiation factor [Nitrospirae bacterium]|nr:translation initiation factor [Nitrospirota bacterium]
MKEKKRIRVGGEPIAWKSPFAALRNVNLPPGSAKQLTDDQADVAPPAPTKNRGRVDILRQTAHRGGKTVTVVTGFVGIGQTEKEHLAKEMQKACGAGGTVKEGRIKIQGDQRQAVAHILANAGFRPVFAGG